MMALAVTLLLQIFVLCLRDFMLLLPHLPISTKRATKIRTGHQASRALDEWHQKMMCHLDWLIHSLSPSIHQLKTVGQILIFFYKKGLESLTPHSALYSKMKEAEIDFANLFLKNESARTYFHSLEQCKCALWGEDTRCAFKGTGCSLWSQKKELCPSRPLENLL